MITKDSTEAVIARIEEGTDSEFFNPYEEYFSPYEVYGGNIDDAFDGGYNAGYQAAINDLWAILHCSSIEPV